MIALASSNFVSEAQRGSPFTLLRTANTDPGGIFSFAAILRPDNPRRLSFATGLVCRWSIQGRPSIVPPSRATAKAALMRSRITLRSNSATAARTCICKRPAGLLSLVSIPCDVCFKLANELRETLQIPSKPVSAHKLRWHRRYPITHHALGCQSHTVTD